MSIRSMEQTGHVMPRVSVISATARCAKAIARGLDLNLSVPPDGIQVETDARAVRQITTNLVENAIKYTDVGSVSLRSEVDAHGLLIEVVDTGAGIPPERLESIFSEFER